LDRTRSRKTIMDGLGIRRSSSAATGGISNAIDHHSHYRGKTKPERLKTKMAAAD
jgi:hypothetical protein